MSKRNIETQRLVLRRWRATDRAPYAAICADPDVMRWIGDGSTKTAKQSENSIRLFECAWQRHGFGLFAIELKATGEMIGFAGLSLPDFLPEVELGWRLAKHHWGRGYATEAARSALDFARHELVLQNIISICQVGNTASLRVAEKLAMQLDRDTVDPSCGRPVRVYRSRRS